MRLVVLRLLPLVLLAGFAPAKAACCAGAWASTPANAPAGFGVRTNSASGSIVVFGQGDGKATAIAFDWGSGRVRWRSDLDRVHDARYYGGASSSTGSRWYFTGGEHLRSDWTESRQTTVALDGRTGKALWTATTQSGSPSTYGHHIFVSRDDRTVFVVGSVGEPPPGQWFHTRVIAYDAATGTPRWRWESSSRRMQETVHALLSPNGRHLLLAGGQTEQGAMVLDAGTGRRLWGSLTPSGPSTAKSPGVRAVAAARDGTSALIARTGSVERRIAIRIVKLDFASGRTMWTSHVAVRGMETSPEAILDTPRGPCVGGLVANPSTYAQTRFAACLEPSGRSRWMRSGAMTRGRWSVFNKLVVHAGNLVAAGVESSGPNSGGAGRVSAYDLASGADRGTQNGRAGDPLMSPLGFAPGGGGMLLASALPDRFSLFKI